MSKKGNFIVIEGLDGSGNSTQANLLFDFFLKKEKLFLQKSRRKDLLVVTSGIF